jgi:hypothetical protein
MRIETNPQSIRQKSRNASFAPRLIFAIKDLNTVHDSIIDCLFLAKLFCSVKKPFEFLF